MTETPPYTALAAGYDGVMAHVDYAAWAAYVQGLLREHAPDTTSVIELGCGTGALAVALQPYGPPPMGYTYRGYDASAAMLTVARQTAQAAGRTIAFARGDFRDPVPGPPADAVVLVYDGLNYLLNLADVERLLGHVHDALVPGGVAILDQSTPANSLNHADGFDDAGHTDAFRYMRSSRFDPATHLHTTTFTLTDDAGRQTTETHVQRAYALADMRRLLARSPLVEVGAYDGFERSPADETTERVHWVLRRPAEARPGRP